MASLFSSSLSSFQVTLFKYSLFFSMNFLNSLFFLLNRPFNLFKCRFTMILLIIGYNGKGALIRKVRDLWKRAGVEPWMRLWQTLRQSCEKEWAMTFPQYAVSKWIGHSITVSGRHYANAVPDELFDKAAQNTAQKLHETGRKSPKSKQRRSTQNASNPANCEDLRRSSSNFNQFGKWSRGESNPRAETVSKPRLHV